MRRRMETYYFAIRNKNDAFVDATMAGAVNIHPLPAVATA